ncbi:hypothetical protein Lalb_Chr03g0041961 [Lupinus albus]|uniref:Uncharacterized protein n=1 Tax=Lupinus albus TaxID=3870 RepID=A0A6A4QYI2_LUPAL|nr:hypothetical protein Lalb_Chr03g0041961 [Lupinus albus]
MDFFYRLGKKNQGCHFFSQTLSLSLSLHHKPKLIPTCCCLSHIFLHLYPTTHVIDYVCRVKKTKTEIPSSTTLSPPTPYIKVHEKKIR